MMMKKTKEKEKVFEEKRVGYLYSSTVTLLLF